MKLRPTLIAMMALSVLSDAILIPFYPLFFAQRYGTTSALHAGAYVAAISLVVMMTLPLWARLAKRIDALHLLTATQCAAGGLSIMSCLAPSLPAFWLVSLLMFMFKSSYLLMYPYLMRLEPADTRAGTIGTLSIAGHFSGIFGAVLGGWLMQAWDAGASMIAMAVADFIQAALCLHLIGTYRIARKVASIATFDANGEVRTVMDHGRAYRTVHWPILRLAFLMFAFDLSAYLARPFFSAYWQQTGISSSEALAGLVFAIPGLIAIATLWINRAASVRGRRTFDHVVPNLLLGAMGLLLHASDAAIWIVVGRCLFGWALFQVTVRLDVTLFRLSNPDAFATDHSIAYFFQNLGVLVASFAAGLIVDHHSLDAPFHYAAAGFAATAVLIVLLRTTVDPDDTRGACKPIAEPAGQHATSPPASHLDGHTDALVP
jgi:predicted MFS family arabinose efflux permease